MCAEVAVADGDVEAVVLINDVAEAMELVLVVVDDKVEEDEDEETEEVTKEDVNGLPESIETMAPRPFKTMPSLPAHHAGSLSQHQLRTLHWTT